MRNRINLHNYLVEKLGSNNVYYDPPENVKLKYPCIIYSLDRAINRRANDSLYNVRERYMVTFIDYDPDSSIPDDILELPLTSLDRTYKTDGLCHFVFTIYY